MSHKTIEARRAYERAWRAAHPTYHRQWNAAHREAEAERRRRWRRANPEKVRAEHRRYDAAHPRRAAEVPPIPALHYGHPLFDKARQIVPLADAAMVVFKSAQEWDREDARSEAVLAMLEGRDPAVAARKCLAEEERWRRFTGPLLQDWGIAA